MAVRSGIPVVQVNAVGGNDELVFDGQSLVAGKKGGVLAQGAPFGEQSWVVDLQGREKTPEWACREEQLFRALVLGTRDYLEKCGFREVVLGLSGGSRFSSEGSVKDAEDLARRLRIRYLKIPIEGPFQSMLGSIAPARGGRTGGLTEENLQSRLRGVVLMAVSNDSGRLLLTTGNKSELAVGYCTLYGDMCGALGVIADVPKTMVYRLARWVNREREIIPKSSIDKAPSAELRPNQTDQDSLP
ncbi:MAG: NAD(+) synthase, partial [Verrucomicrobia bacterium]|nr:NAD(+) synthase [Verrucomicrobiota bacterium]